MASKTQNQSQLPVSTPPQTETTKVNRMHNLSLWFKKNQRSIVVISLILIPIGLLLMCILLPLSFGYIEYHEMGLLKGRVNGKVNIDKVYSSGRHFIGPSYTFQKYPASVLEYTVYGVSLVSSDKLETDVDITMLYFLNPQYLGKLQQEFNVRYQTVIEARALSAIKNTAVQFTTQQFFQNRSMIIQAFHTAIQADLEKNLYVLVPYFYMAGLSIPPVVSQKQLQTAIQNQVNQQQQYENQATLVRQDTTTLANQLINNATVIIQQANAEANAMVQEAKAEAYQTVELARSESLKKLYSAINVTDSSSITQIDYAFTLLNSANYNIHVGYQTLLKTTS